MKEILFRGKMMDADGWVYGTFLKDGEPFKINLNHPFSNCYIVPETDLDNIKSKTSGGAYFLQTTAFHVFPETVGQYTGLNDKNKAKIFEGDIVRCYDRNLDDEFTAVVEFGNPNGAYNWGFQLRPITKTNFNTDILLWTETEETGAFIEVIGNIHDNPELLKGEENG